MNPQDVPSTLFPKSKAQLNREKYAAQAASPVPAKAPRRIRERRPVFGSQQWAETRGDDLGLSADY